jgi:hypothetical protein
VQRGSLSLLLLVAVVFFVPACFAQSAPQHTRDYIYGPGGRLITTAEPDTYPPSAPSYIGVYPAGQCASDGMYVSWGSSTDFGTGVAYYTVSGLGNTTAFSFTDYNIQPNTTYTYYVNAVDNAGNVGDSVSASNSVPLCMCSSKIPLLCPRSRNHSSGTAASLFTQPVEHESSYLRTLCAVHLVKVRPQQAPSVASVGKKPQPATTADPPPANPPIKSGDSKADKPAQQSTSPPTDVKHTPGGGR